MTRAGSIGVLLIASLVQAGPAGAASLAEQFTVSGYAAGRGALVEGRRGWLEGGFGKTTFGGADRDDEDVHAAGDLHVTVEWLPSAGFGAFVHATGRLEPSAGGGRGAGVVEAFLHGNVPLGPGRTLRLRLGHFLLPTSRENVEVGWSSPYTLTFSALNSWIGEEVRPTGLWAELALPAGGDADELRLGGTVFGGNDTSGALIAWRGWAMHDRLTVFDEPLPLPPLPSILPGGHFARQRDDGTVPFEDDLDDRWGWAAHARWQRFERAAVTVTHYDNRADRRFYRGEYAWENDFDLVGAEWHTASRELSLLGEAMRGRTGMGPHAGPFYVQVDYRAAYLLASWAPGPVRVSLRWDTFETEDLDRARRGRPNGEDGDAWTVAAFWEPRPDLRLGVEVLDLDARRPAVGELTGDPDVGATAVRLDLRWYFDVPR